jgi:hypothetical protein
MHTEMHYVSNFLDIPSVVLSHMRTDDEAMASTVFSDVKPCSLVGVYGCCGGIHFLHLLGFRASQARSKHNMAHLFDLLFDLEDGISKLIWNNGRILSDYTTSHPRR